MHQVIVGKDLWRLRSGLLEGCWIAQLVDLGLNGLPFELQKVLEPF